MQSIGIIQDEHPSLAEVLNGMKPNRAASDGCLAL
jgi:hypothetical protein